MNEQRIIIVLDGISLADRIAAGRYDGFVHPSIKKDNFPHDPMTVGTWECKTFDFRRHVSFEEAESAIIADGWKSGKLEHQLAFGEKYPDVQREYPVVALGSSCLLYCRRLVPYLYSYASLRNLNFSYWNGGWFDYYRVLAVREVV